jgi:hypothetical protein
MHNNTNTTKYTVRINLYVTVDAPNDLLETTGHSILGYALNELAGAQLPAMPANVTFVAPAPIIDPADDIARQYWPA